MNDQGRIFYLDVARVIAIISITFNHAVNRTYFNYTSAIQTEFYSISRYSTLFKTLVTVFSRLGVPLFLMITGALLLNRKYDTKAAIRRFYTHNYLDLLITSEIWLFLGYWFIVLLDPVNNYFAHYGVAGSIIGCIKNLLFFDMINMGSMWYILMILCVYILIPIIAIFLQKSPSPNLIMIPVILMIMISYVIPTVNVYLPRIGIHEKVLWLNAVDLFSPYLIYIIFGFYLSNKVLEKIPSALLITGTVATFAICCAFQYYCYSWSTHLVSYQSPGILLCSLLLFEVIRRFGNKLLVLNKLISNLSRISFAIYLVHIFIMSGFFWYFDFTGFSRPGKFFFLEAVSFFGSILIIWIFSYIPFCRKRVFLIK